MFNFKHIFVFFVSLYKSATVLDPLDQNPEAKPVEKHCSKQSSVYLTILAHKYRGNTNDSNITKQMAATNLPLFANSRFTQSVIKSQ